MLVTTLGYDDYRGVTAVGRIFAGTIKAGQAAGPHRPLDGQILPERARYLYVHQGLERVEVEQAEAGEIVALAGLEGIAIGETLADPEQPGRPAPHPGGRADRAHDLWRQHLALRRARRPLGHLAQAARAPVRRAAHQRGPARGRDREPPTPSWSPGAASCTWRS